MLIDFITTQFLWHGGMIDAEIQNGQITKRYIFINLRPVAVIEYENVESRDKNDSVSGSKYAGYKPNGTPKSASIYAIYTDHLGTPQAITDDKQAVVWRADYATFGKATVHARVVDSSSKTAKNSFGIISTAYASVEAATATGKPFEFNLRFAGQYEDVESGYHYNWHRYYDPSTGRYLTPDPIGLAGGLNGYGYAGQDPMGAVDPWGLYSLVVGFEVNKPEAFTGGVHNLDTANGGDYGHMFYYLMDDNGKITDTFSFGPTEGITKDSQYLTGRKATADYEVSEAAKLTAIDINFAQYALLRAQIAADRLRILLGQMRYRELSNTTCGSTAVDNIGSALTGLGIPVG